MRKKIKEFLLKNGLFMSLVILPVTTALGLDNLKPIQPEHEQPEDEQPEHE